jgi:hypothetical protein
MALTSAEVTYFITQVGLAATSFGVTVEDATAIGQTLNSAFNYACLPASALVDDTPVLNSICDGTGCPMASNANCSAYDNVVQSAPASASSTARGSTATGSSTSSTQGSPTNTAQNPTGTSSNGGLTAAAKVGLGVGVGLGVPLLVVLGLLLFRRRPIPSNPEFAELSAKPPVHELHAQEPVPELAGPEMPVYELGGESAQR